MPDEPIKYVSVTAITSLLPKNLTWWAGNAVADCAFFKQHEWRDLPSTNERYEYVRRAHDRIKSSAADLGTEIHAFIESRNLGKPEPVYPLPVKARMHHFADFMATVEPRVEAAEVKCYSRTHGFAGTADMFLEIDGRMAVCDLKTGKQIWPEAALQCAAYARSDFIVADPNHPGAVQVTPGRGKRFYTWSGPPEDEIPVPDCEVGYVLHLRDDGWDLHEVTDLDAAFEMFLAILPIDRWEREVKKSIIRLLPKATVDQSVMEFGDVA